MKNSLVQLDFCMHCRSQNRGMYGEAARGSSHRGGARRPAEVRRTTIPVWTGASVLARAPVTTLETPGRRSRGDCMDKFSGFRRPARGRSIIRSHPFCRSHQHPSMPAIPHPKPVAKAKQQGAAPGRPRHRTAGGSDLRRHQDPHRKAIPGGRGRVCPRCGRWRTRWTSAMKPCCAPTTS